MGGVLKSGHVARGRSPRHPALAGGPGSTGVNARAVAAAAAAAGLRVPPAPAAGRQCQSPPRRPRLALCSRQAAIRRSSSSSSAARAAGASRCRVARSATERRPVTSMWATASRLRALTASSVCCATPSVRQVHSAPRPRGRPLTAMPQPRGARRSGMPLSLAEEGHARLHLYVDQLHRELGGVFQDQIAPDSESIVFVADPDEMRRTFGLEGKYPMHVVPQAWVVYNQTYGCKRGLFFMDGENWLHMRRVMNKLMLKPEAHIFSEPCQHVADALVSKWRQNRETEILDLEGQLYKWSLDTVIAVMVGNNYKAHEGKWASTVRQLASDIHKIFLESAEMSSKSAKEIERLRDEGRPVWKRFKNSVDVSLSSAHSLLQEMISVCSTSPSGLLSEMQHSKMSEEDIIKVVVDLILAAGDTTAMSLQWTLFLLAKNPEVQEDIKAEICDKTDMLQSPLLRGVIREALRLYPVAPFLIRIMPESCVLGGYELPPYKPVFLSLYSSGRDAKSFSEPEKFWPERWLRENTGVNENLTGAYKGVTNSYASMPFAIGARSCIGRKLAETQMIVTLASILKQFKMELLNSNDIGMVMRLVAVPSEPIRLRLICHKEK